MPASKFAIAASVGVLGLLSACGGDSAPAPPAPVATATPAPFPKPSPSPAPSPSPTPTSVPLSGPPAIAAVGEFAVLSAFVSYTSDTEGRNRADRAEQFDGTRFRYRASGDHELLLPTLDWITLLKPASGTASFTTQRPEEASGRKGIELLLLRTDAAVLDLDFSGDGWWYMNRLIEPSPGRRLNQYGAFTSGVATPMSAVPTTGRHTYTCFVDVEGYGTPSPVTLTIDFGTRAIEGSLRATVTEFGGAQVLVGTYPFAASLPAGQTTFVLDIPLDAGRIGRLDGQFAGPAAQGVMLRFRGTIPCIFVNGGPCDVIGAGAAKRPSP